MPRRFFAVLLFGLATTATAAVSDMSITKTTQSPVVNPGQSVQYTIQAHNMGPDAGPMTITDVLPAGSTFGFVDTAFSGGFTCSGTSTVTCTSPGPVPVTGIGGPIIRLVINAPSTFGPFINTATVSSTSSDPNPADNRSSAPVTVAAANTVADLSLEKFGPQLPVPTGSAIIYTLIVSNNGPSTEPTPVVTDVLPAGVTLVSANPVNNNTTVSCSGTTTVVCNFGPIPFHGSSGVSLVVKAPPIPGAFTNNASVTGSLVDLNPANNTASVTSNAVSGSFSSELSITKTKTNPLVTDIQPGQSIVYLLTVTNNGPDLVSSYTVTDVIPPQARYDLFGSIDPRVSCTGTTTVVCTFPELPAGSERGVFLFVTAPQLGGPFTNTATVAPGAGSGTDPNAANNSASLTLNVVGPAVIPSLSLSGLMLLMLLCAALGVIALRR